MHIKPVFSEEIGLLSYMLIVENEIFVVDPQRDVQVYLDEAKRRDLPVTGVLLTHPHADYVSGHSELARKTGAKIYAHHQAPFQSDTEKLKEGDTLRLDHIKIDILETPGHTPYCLSYVITDLQRGDKPVSVFTGDTLFVGETGRPDLVPGMLETLVEQLYDSLHNKLMRLDDYVEVYPAHAAGSLCGNKMSEKQVTTIGYERRFNPRLQLSREDFIKTLLDEHIPVPEHFKRSAGINLKMPELLENLPEPEPVGYDFFKQHKDLFTLDIRPHLDWVNLHLPGALHMDVDCLSFANYAGWLIPPDKPVLMIHPDPEKVRRAVHSMRLIGLDQPVYYLENGIKTLVYHGEKLASVPKIMPGDLLQGKYNGMTLLDVRTNPGPLPGVPVPVEHIPATAFFEGKPILDKDRDYILMCEKGALAGLTASLLEKQGYRRLHYLVGSAKALKNIAK